MEQAMIELFHGNKLVPEIDGIGKTLFSIKGSIISPSGFLFCGVIFL